jgi:methanethiol S-methyltransferase
MPPQYKKLKSKKMATLILTWLLFFVAHSLFASTQIKAYFEKKISGQAYRLFYNFQSIALFALVIYQLLFGEKVLVFPCYIALCIIGCILIFIGLYIMYAAFKQINISAFLGFQQIEMESNGLNTEGVYAMVRHPLYWGIMLVLVGLFLFIPYYSILISMIMSIIYMAIGIEFEEKKLRTLFGEQYTIYAKGKKKFVPYIY